MELKTAGSIFFIPFLWLGSVMLLGLVIHLQHLTNLFRMHSSAATGKT